MPVRIYDLAKKLGLENKVVLGKAKDLGMKEAKVPSSSLDKITAQYLEDELVKEHPQAAAAVPAAPQPPPPAPLPPTPITIISEPPPPAPEPVAPVMPVEAVETPAAPAP